VLAWITYTDVVSTLAKLGAVILLFVIGLEFKLKDIGRLRYFWVALFGVIVPCNRT
jgi:Kef-type K+ transport system membrane component KefB